MPDTERPYIKSVTPSPNATDVSISTIVSIEFSERMRASSINRDSIGLFKDPLVPVSSTITYTDSTNVAILEPADYLETDTRYAVVISGTVQDYAGNRMGVDYWYNFWTEADTTGGAYVSGDQAQPPLPSLNGYIQVIGTTPENYSTNCDTDSLDRILIKLSDYPAIGNRNFFGGLYANTATFGSAFFEDIDTSYGGYISIINSEVTGNPNVDHTPPIYTIQPSGTVIVINASGMLDNNEYIVTINKGLPGLNTYPLQEKYSFVFTSTYDPLYIGCSLVRLNIGPILQITMNYVPDDTINRIIYSVSKQADYLSPVPLDPTNLPWYVREFVLYQTLINGIYASLLMFGSSGAGIRKTLGDLTIDINAAGLMPLIMPILDDYRKMRDKYKDMVESGTGELAGPETVVRAELDSRRPITDNTWRRLPLSGSVSTAPVDTLYNRWVYTSEYSMIG